MKTSRQETPLPRIDQEPSGIRIFVGNQQYLLKIQREAFEDAFSAGLRCLRLNDGSPDFEGDFSKAELDEVRQQIVTEAIRFLAINQLPLRVTEEVFLRPRVIRAVFEKAEAKFKGRSEDVYQLTAKTVDGTPDEVRRVVANFDARAAI